MLAALPGAEALLQTGAAMGLYMGVVSNKTGTYLRQEVAHLDWGRYFGRLVGAQDAARDKPAPDPIWLVLKDTDIAPGPDVWFIGDAGIDVTCGRAAGCTTILLHGRPAGDVVPHREVAACHNLAELLKAVLAEDRAAAG
jgi:phosphoglycolate phosphatase